MNNGTKHTDDSSMESYSSMFFQNTACPHFPCHQDIARSEFNCMFCYCPLYALGADCGGEYRITKRGLKDCSACVHNHLGIKSADWIRERLPLVLNATAKMLSTGETESEETA